MESKKEGGETGEGAGQDGGRRKETDKKRTGTREREKGKDNLSFVECAPGLGMVPSTSHM